jgi:hypothetical protein
LDLCLIFLRFRFNRLMRFFFHLALIVNERVGFSQERADEERSLQASREAITAAEKRTKLGARVIMKA